MATLGLLSPNTLNETARQSKSRAVRTNPKDMDWRCAASPLVSGLKDFILEKRPLVANLSADLDFLA